jgi:aspartyl protease family protein
MSGLPGDKAPGPGGDAMSMRDNRFLEPEKSGGVLSWAIRQLALWLIAGVGVYLLIAGRGLFLPQLNTTSHRPPAAAAPAAGRDAAPAFVTNSLVLRAGRDGHVYAEAEINGTLTRMVFDTGASFVSLTRDDAERAGVAGGLNYTLPLATSNGKAFGAPVTLRELRIGELDLSDVRAVVMPDLTVSLLGQSFLSRLQSYQMQDGVMTLTWQ